MKDARYHAFCILKEFDRSNDRLKFVRDKYYKKTKLEQNDLSRTLVLTMRSFVGRRAWIIGYRHSSANRLKSFIPPSILF